MIHEVQVALEICIYISGKERYSVLMKQICPYLLVMECYLVNTKECGGLSFTKSKFCLPCTATSGQMLADLFILLQS